MERRRECQEIEKKKVELKLYCNHNYLTVNIIFYNIKSRSNHNVQAEPTIFFRAQLLINRIFLRMMNELAVFSHLGFYFMPT